MDYNDSFAISATGMAVEKLRLDVAAANLANMNSSAPSVAQLYRPAVVVATENPLGFFRQFSSLTAGGGAGAGGVRGVGVQALQVAPRMVHEPGHPHADAKGNVAYPGVDHGTQMVNISSALRAYEANVVAMNAARVMAARTLEIGGQQ
jgi:flagellar basal-body rod protein FlgC